ncbi:hypothetical protein TWF281_004634 [Arthrobotrys megalospora]
MLLTCGLPPRGTEMMCLRKYNTASNARNFVVIDGDLAIVSSYVKTLAVTGVSKGIARFFPPDIGSIFATYLAVVDLFVDYLRKRSGRPLSAYLFCNKKGGPWDPSVLSDNLQLKATPILGFLLKLGSYRQIIASITKVYLREVNEVMDEHVDELKDTIAEQFGHGVKVHFGRYGRTARTTLETEETTLIEFRKVSIYFHFFVGAIDRLPDWILLPSKILFPQVGAVDPHPFFSHVAFPQNWQGKNPFPILERQIHAEPVAPTVVTPIRAEAAVAATAGVVTKSYSSHPSFPIELHRQLTNVYGKRARWKVPEQADAAAAIFRKVLSPLLVVLPCAAGKTSAALIAVGAGSGVTLIVEPFISTCEDVNRRAGQMGLQSVFWTLESTQFPRTGPGIVVTTPEGAITAKFLNHVAEAARNRVLDAVIVNEVHQPLLDEGFQNLGGLSKLTNINLPLTVITATMPPTMMSNLAAFFHVPAFHEIRVGTNAPNMSYHVHTTSDIAKEAEYYAKYYLDLVPGEEKTKNLVLVFCRSLALANLLQEKLNSNELIC